MCRCSIVLGRAHRSCRLALPRLAPLRAPRRARASPHVGSLRALASWWGELTCLPFLLTSRARPAPCRELRVARARAPSSCRDESARRAEAARAPIPARSADAPKAAEPTWSSCRVELGGALPAPSRGSRCSAPLTSAPRRGTDGAVTNVGRAAWPGAARQLLRGRPRRGSPPPLMPG